MSLFAAHDDDVKPSFSARYDTIGDAVTAYADNAQLVYATDDGAIVGVLIVDPAGERETIAAYCPCPYVKLALVGEAYRNRGIGTALLDAAIEHDRPDGDDLCLRTRVDNARMRHVCERLGFVREGKTSDDGHERLYYRYPSAPE